MEPTCYPFDTFHTINRLAMDEAASDPTPPKIDPASGILAFLMFVALVTIPCYVLYLESEAKEQRTQQRAR